MSKNKNCHSLLHLYLLSLPTSITNTHSGSLSWHLLICNHRIHQRRYWRLCSCLPLDQLHQKYVALCCESNILLLNNVQLISFLYHTILLNSETSVSTISSNIITTTSATLQHPEPHLLWKWAQEDEENRLRHSIGCFLHQGYPWIPPK